MFARVKMRRNLGFVSDKWLITWLNPPYTEDDAYCLTERFCVYNNVSIKKAVWQLEKGSTKGTPHFQAYILLDHKVNLSFWLTHPTFGKKINYQAVSDKDAKRCEGYCKKKDTRLCGPYVYEK